MRRILVLQHVPWEILGTLDPLLRSSGFRIRYVNFGRHPHAKPSLDGYRGLVILGGPMNVDDVDRHPHLETERELIARAIDRGIPVLGICLGAQLIARTLGAEVRAGAAKEIGWYDVAPTAEGRSDPLVRHFGDSERIFQWHGDVFEIPAGAVHLAEGGGSPNQAFRYGENVYGFQFHLEVDRPMVERWLRVPSNLEELRSVETAVDPESILEETERQIAALHVLSDRTFAEFARLLGPERRARVLPSR